MTDMACFAGGCFWCITPALRSVEGVTGVTCGYSGGQEQNPAYEDVKHQRTGHRECISVRFDPARVTYEALLEQFLASVDPFDDGGQFIDRGHSYTLAVYWADEHQRDAAHAAIRRLEEASGRQACISVEPLHAFWTAEEEHQDYDLKHPEAFRQELIDSGRIRE